MSLAERGAHLAALWALAVVAPLLHVLGYHPQLFASRGWSGAAIILFTLGLSVVAPLLLLGAEWIVGMVSEALGWALHLVVLGFLVGAIVLQVFALDAALTASVLALTCSIGAVLVYTRSHATRSLLGVLTPAPVVFAALFLLFSDVSDLVFSHRADVRADTGAARAPVVLVIFDELPVSSLMDAGGHLDARRFPNFARLARDATWYRNTASVDQDTPYAVPGHPGRPAATSRAPPGRSGPSAASSSPSWRAAPSFTSVRRQPPSARRAYALRTRATTRAREDAPC